MASIDRDDLQSCLSGIVLDEHVPLSLPEVCRICDIGEEMVLEMVEEGLIEPRRSGRAEWHFTWREIRRVKVACRLNRDLRVNLPGAAIIIDLLEELEELRNASRPQDGMT